MLRLNDGISSSDLGLVTTQEALIAGQALLQEMQTVNSQQNKVVGVWEEEVRALDAQLLPKPKEQHRQQLRSIVGQW